MELMRVITAAMSQPWAILPHTGAAIWNVLCRRASGVRLADDEVVAIVAARPAHATHSATPQAIAVIPVMGVIAHRAAMVEGVSGPRGTGTDALTQQFRQALLDPDVGAIVFDVDSPGGGVFGVPELAQEIREARGRKPIIAVANAMAASAAYWIASQADELVVTPSGEVGSIGVYAMHEDWSKWADQEGIATTFVYAGAFKVEGHPFAPLSDEARAKMQDDVDGYYEQFTSAVARGRGVARSVARSEAFGQGRMFLAENAVARGLADRVATLDDVIVELAKGTWERPARRSEALIEEPAPTVVTDVVVDGVVVGVDIIADVSANDAAVARVERRRRALAYEALR